MTKEKFSETEDGRKWLLEAVEGNPELAINETYSLGIKAGEEKGRAEVIENMKTPFIDEAERQSALSVLGEVEYEIEKLNTIELKEKAPICWLKLQQCKEKLARLEERIEK